MGEQVTSTLIEAAVIPDFAGVHDFQHIQSRFIDSARSIMLGHDLVHGDNSWQISALELYLTLNNRPDIWCDHTTHGVGDEHEQLKRGTWYVHHDGKLPSKRLGIDITAGSKSEDIFSGLLIGALDQTDGSGRAVKMILRGHARRGDSWDYSPEEWNTIRVKIHRSKIDTGPLRIVPRAEPRKGCLWIGPRKLGPKVPEFFRSCPLRVATWPTGPTMKPL